MLLSTQDIKNGGVDRKIIAVVTLPGPWEYIGGTNKN
jgi:hypothetical protein